MTGWYKKIVFLLPIVCALLAYFGSVSFLWFSPSGIQQAGWTAILTIGLYWAAIAFLMAFQISILMWMGFWVYTMGKPILERRRKKK